MVSETIDLRDLPPVEGLSFRFARPEDAEALCAVHAARAARDQVDPHSLDESLPNLEHLRQTLSKEAAAGKRQRLVAQVHGEVVGYSLVESWQEDDGRWVYLVLGWVRPERRGRGIGTALLRWGETSARRLALSEHPGELCELAANASSTEQDSTALLLHEGYWVAYTVLEMRLDPTARLSPCPLPAGLDLRPTLPEHYPQIVESIIEAYRGEYPDGRFQEAAVEQEHLDRIGGPGYDPALFQVAWDGERVAAQVIPTIENGRATITEVSVRPAYRRRGLARSLLTRALLDLRARGVEEIRLLTVANFPTRACDLYASLGFEVIKKFPRYRKAMK